MGISLTTKLQKQSLLAKIKLHTFLLYSDIGQSIAQWAVLFFRVPSCHNKVAPSWLGRQRFKSEESLFYLQIARVCVLVLSKPHIRKSLVRKANPFYFLNLIQYGFSWSFYASNYCLEFLNLIQYGFWYVFWSSNNCLIFCPLFRQ